MKTINPAKLAARLGIYCLGLLILAFGIALAVNSNLGVSPMKTFFTVTARMMLPGIMSGAVLSWITCINELSSSIMLYSGKTSTIAVAIYQEVTRMSDGTAGALATILTLTTIISLIIVFRLTKGKVKIV